MNTATTLFLIASLCGPAYGQAPAQTAKNPEPTVLGGPKVEKPAPKTSLVHRDFNGKLERLETSPEEAALKLLPLSEDEKKNADLILTERSALMDKAISKNIPMLLKFQGFREAPRKDKLAMLKEWNEVLLPIRSRGKLADELAAGLSPEHAGSLRDLVKEYWEAVVADGLKAEESMGEKPSKAQVVSREYLLALGAEIKRSYDRVIAGRTAQLDDALKKIEATPEQRDTIKAMSLEFFQKTLGKATQDQKRDFMLKVLGVLDAEQKRTLLRELYGTK